MENLSWYKLVMYLGTVSMAFINLATSLLGMINPIETFTLVYNLYLSGKYLPGKDHNIYFFKGNAELPTKKKVLENSGHLLFQDQV